MKKSIRKSKKAYKKGMQINNTYTNKCHMYSIGIYIPMLQNFVHWGNNIPSHCGKLKSKFKFNSPYTKDIIIKNIAQRETQIKYIKYLNTLSN